MHKTFLSEIFKQIIDEMDIGLHVIDEIGQTIVYNKKMMLMESMELIDVIDKNLLEVFKFKSDQESTLLQALHKGKETKNVKQTYFNNKGKEITTINNTFPLLINGEIRGAAEIARDVTKLEKLIRNNAARKGDTAYTFESIIGESSLIKEVIEHAKRATRTSSSVLIIGETGTGKELFAQSIHNGSARSASPFVSQNCAAIPDNLLESILFGTKKGAFTGSVDYPGLFEQAHGGTLLLDEINSLNISLQAKLLRVLQERSIRRIGDSKDISVDVRIIATINEDPIEAIANGHLRKDLYYRLGVVTLFIPPLRNRMEDIQPLVESFIADYNSLFQMEVKEVEGEVLSSFYQYDWPGNVRELEHIVEGAMNLIMDEESIEYAHLPFHYRNKFMFKHAKPIQLAAKKDSNPEKITSLKKYLKEAEKSYLKKALDMNSHNITKTAEMLGISRQSLQYRIKK
ncbi:sigma-54 interaction domain-containing protein [Peribacillus sp. B-H-3]|uniref:sigma-54 interaction domain-containing protein n=1 Tax=Peribacillus sp. B-H-3 TaxID=3400420 RepID=UPI003B0183CB